MRSKAILTLALPIVIAQLGSILQGWADTIMVGWYGTPELSASGFVNNVFNLVIYFLLGISYASTPVVGDYFSKGDYDSVVQARRSSVLVNVIASVVVIGLLLLLYNNVERLGQPVELMPLIKPYFLVLLSSLPFLAAFNALKQCFDATGDTKTPMYVMLGGNVLNVALNYLLIFGNLGCPELGLTGAGVATLVARVMMLAVLLAYRRKGSYLAKFKGDWTFRDAGRLTRLGIPISVQLCLEAGSFNVCALFMGWIGATALAAHQVMCTVSTMGFMVYYGIGAAAAIRIAYYKGQGEWGEVRATALTALWMSFVSSLMVIVPMCLFGHQIAALFTTSPEVVAMVVTLIPPLVCYQVGDCMQTIFANCLRAIADVKYLMLFAVIAYAIVSVPFAYIFAFVMDGGAEGVWWSFPFGLTTAGVLYYVRFRYSAREGATSCS